MLLTRYLGPNGGPNPKLYRNEFEVTLSTIYYSSMAPTETINYRLSLFFNLSFIGDKWATINDKSIFLIFAYFLPNFHNFASIHWILMI